MSYQPAPPVVGSLGLGSAYDPAPPVGVGDPSDLDKYKALALQAAKDGKTPGQVSELIKQQIVTDMKAKSAASGQTFQSHLSTLKAQTGVGVGNIFNDISKAVSSVGHDVSQLKNAGNDIANAAKDIDHVANNVIKQVGPEIDKIAKAAGHIPWGTIIHDVQAAVSLVPGLGTAVSDVVAAAESAYDSAAAIASHNPLAAALDSAYNFALASVPGADALRGILDPVKNTLIQLGHIHEPIQSRVLDSVLQNVPDSPRIGHLSPRSIAASLAKALVKHVGIRHGEAAAASPPSQTQAQIAAKNLGVTVKPPASKPAPAPPVGHPHPHRPRPGGSHKYAPYPR